MSPQKPPHGALAVLFFRLVNFTFGGGDPTMAALERELVERRHWLDPGRYALAYGLARVTPGTNVVAFCAAVAWFLRGWPGALIAVTAGTLPSTLIVVWLTWGYGAVRTDPLARHAIAGMLAAAVGMMFAAAWNLVRPALRRHEWIRAMLLAGGAALLAGLFHWPPLAVLAAAAVGGALWYRPEAE